MSEESHDGGRRRRRNGLPRMWWAWAGGGVLVLLLVVNLAMSLPGLIRGDSSGGFLADLVSPATARWLGLWTALLPAAGAAVVGYRWAAEAFARSERPAFMWMRRAFVVMLTSWIALIVVIMDDEVFGDRTTALIAAAAIFSFNAIPFAMAARAASQGRFGGRGPSDGSGGSRRRRRSSREQTEQNEQVQA